MKNIVRAIAIGIVAMASSSAGAHPGGGPPAGVGGASIHGPMAMPSTAPSTPSTASAQAATPKATGQPHQQCGSATAPNTPGNAAAAPGSPFNPNGVSGTKYAGQQPQNSDNPAAVSQYDVACANQP